MVALRKGTKGLDTVLTMGSARWLVPVEDAWESFSNVGVSQSSSSEMQSSGSWNGLLGYSLYTPKEFGSVRMGGGRRGAGLCSGSGVGCLTAAAAAAASAS